MAVIYLMLGRKESEDQEIKWERTRGAFNGGD